VNLLQGLGGLVLELLLLLLRSSLLLCLLLATTIVVVTVGVVDAATATSKPKPQRHTQPRQP
jgi:hypothetical protein